MTTAESSISERLEGQHVLLTGVTGFVGEALLRLMLAEVPGVRVTVLVRPKGSTSGTARTASLLKKPIFADVVAAAGGVEELMAARVGVLEGDLYDAPALPAGLDAIVHCAGDVSFDPPVDEGFRTNVQGARELLARVREAGSDIHYVHISTAYVAGRRRGSIPEGPVPQVVDLEAELAWGLGQRKDIEHRSRGTEVLTAERKKAEKEHSRAGLLTAANATEEARKQWVKDELVRVGAERARSLGWTDCYTFTKALGERIVEEHARTNRVSIVRPSIIESALVSPYPGWIEGFKMMEPLILAYGRGELPEMPGAADTTVDVVPVDHVVAAIVAVLAHPPEVGDPGVLPRLVGRPQPVDLPDALRERARLLRRAPVHLRGPRRDPPARVALPGLAVRRAPAQHQRTRLQGGRLRDRPRTAQRPHARPGPQARPAGPTPGVPAALPRALPGVRPGGAAVLRHQHARALPLAVRGRPGDVRLRHGGGRLEGLPPGHPLPGGDGTDPSPRRGASRPQAPGRERPEGDGREARDRGVLRHGRHAAVLERDRDLPVAAAAGALGHRAVRGAEPDRDQGAQPDPGRAPRAQRLPALGLSRVRRCAVLGPGDDRRRAPHRPRADAAVAGRGPQDP